MDKMLLTFRLLRSPKLYALFVTLSLMLIVAIYVESISHSYIERGMEMNSTSFGFTQPSVQTSDNKDTLANDVNYPLNQESHSQIITSNNLCDLPCWMNVHPGETTEATFRKLADSLPDRFDQFECHTFPTGGTQCNWVDNVTHLLGGAEIRHDVVVYLTLTPLKNADLEIVLGLQVPMLDIPPDKIVAPFSPGNIKLRDATQLLGTPDSYSGVLLTIHDQRSLSLSLFYESEGLVVAVNAVPFNEEYLVDYEHCQIEITPDLIVSGLYFMEIGITDEAMNSYAPLVFNERQAWPGFGIVNLALCR